MADEHLGERGFTAAVFAHDGVRLALLDRQGDAREDLLAGLRHLGREVLHLEQHVALGGRDLHAGRSGVSAPARAGAGELWGDARLGGERRRGNGGVAHRALRCV